jgi:hypothetical protein
MRKDTYTFKTLMKASGWKKHYYMPIGSSIDVYALNGFTAHFQNYYMVIYGQMPVTKALKLFNSVEKALEIRADGHGCNISPSETRGSNKAIMKYLDELLEQGTPLKDLDKICKIRENKLLETNPEDFFIDTYHIDTWKGFEVFSKFIVDNNIKSTWFD